MSLIKHGSADRYQFSTVAVEQAHPRVFFRREGFAGLVDYRFNDHAYPSPDIPYACACVAITSALRAERERIRFSRVN